MSVFRKIFQSLFFYPKPLWPLAAFVGYILIVLSTPLWGTVILVGVALGMSRKTQTRLIRSWLSVVCAFVHLKFVVEGRENFNPDEPSLVVSNHQSLFDIPAAYIALRGDLRMVAKKELFKIPFFGWCLSKTEFIPVDRGNRQSGHEASVKISERIKSGLHIWVAPEGTRSPTGQIAPFKKGSFSVAIGEKLPVQPILILNSRLACPKGSILVRPGTVIQVKVLPRVSTEGYLVENRGALAEKVQTIMKQEYEKFNNA